MAENEIRLGVTPEGFQQSERQVSSLYRSAESGLQDLILQADEFAAKWESLWEQQPRGDALRAFVSGTGQAFQELGQGAERADRQLTRLRSNASEMQTILDRLSEEGIDTTRLTQQANQIQGLFERIQQIQAEQAPAVEAGVPRAEVAEPTGLRDALGEIRSVVEEMAGSFDELAAQQREAAPRREPEEAPAMMPLDRFNLVLAQTVTNLERFNQQLEQGGRKGRQREEDEERRGRQRQARERVQPPVFERAVQRYLPGGFVGQEIRGRMAGRAAQRLLGGAGRAAGGAAAGAGGGGAAGMMGALGGGAMMAVAAPLAALVAGGLLYRGLRGKAERFEAAAIATEQIARRSGIQTTEQAQRVAEFALPTREPGALQRQRAFREEFGFGREQIRQILGQVEAPRLMDPERGPETLLRGVARFARLQGQDPQQVAQMANQLGRMGLGPEQFENILNRVMGEVMAEGTAEGIARSDTMRSIMNFTQQTVRVMGEADAKAVANAAAMVEAFTRTGVGAFMPGRGGAEQRLIGGIAGGAQDPQRFAMFMRAMDEVATRRNVPIREFMQETFEQIAPDDPERRQLFAQLPNVFQGQILQETIAANPQLLGRILPQMIGQGRLAVGQQMMLLRTMTGDPSGSQALNVLTAMQKGLSRNLEIQGLAAQLQTQQRVLTPEEEQRIEAFAGGEERREELRRVLTPEQFAETRRLFEAREVAQGRRAEMDPLLDLGEQSLRVQSSAADAADVASRNASDITRETAIAINELKETVSHEAGRIISVLQGQPVQLTPEEQARREVVEPRQQAEAEERRRQVGLGLTRPMTPEEYQARERPDPNKVVRESHQTATDEQIADAKESQKFGNANNQYGGD
jgi:hypothetical protein